MSASLQTEQNILGALFMDPRAWEALSSIVRAEHFGEPIHARTFGIAAELANSGKPISISTLLGYLGEGEIAPGITPRQYLAHLAANALPAALVPGMARHLRDVANQRAIVAIADDLKAKAMNAGPATFAADLSATAIAELQLIADAGGSVDTRRDPGESARIVVDRARAIMAGERRDLGVSTGLPDLDRATGGFQPGTLWILAGRPRMGKTILATGFAKRVALRGACSIDAGEPAVGVALFSLEVTEDQIIARLLADLAYRSHQRVTYGDVMRGALDETGLSAIEGAQATLATLPLSLDVAPGLSLAEIAARVRSEKARMARKGVRLAVVLIDYLKFVKASDRYAGNRVYEIGEISAGLKQLAKAENVCIVLLAQLNRGVEARDRKDKTPGLADLRESGDLEADADVVVFIDRESVRIKQSAEYRAGDPDALDRFLATEHRADLIVAKTRVGAERTVPLWIDAGCSTFACASRGAF